MLQEVWNGKNLESFLNRHISPTPENPEPAPETYLYCLVHRKLPAPPGLLCQPWHPHSGSPFSLSASVVFLVHNCPVQNKARTCSQKDHLVDSSLLKQPLLLSSLAVQEHSSAQIHKEQHGLDVSTDQNLEILQGCSAPCASSTDLCCFLSSQHTPVKSKCESTFTSFNTSPSSPSRITRVIISARSEAF